ncbi:MAG: BREX-3 system P-loop-containing protein BrxF [Clostridiales bacterium]|jgi:hypothetical protein|nr:BREX-3 system P-loop-containing protein BrxF [Clostridiales bacterium]
MGNIINNRTLTASKMLALPPPVVLCVNRADFDSAITKAQFRKVSLNLPLAKKLISKPATEAITDITGIILSLLPKGEALYLTDFEILFDPCYKLDVLKLFVGISRHHKLIVKWCGGINKESLTFAEAGYDDYRKYEINDYNITFVI